MIEDVRNMGESGNMALFQLAPVSISLAHLNDVIIDVNPQFTKFLGYSKEEAEGRSFNELTHPEDQEESQRQHNEMVQGKIDHFDMKKRYLTKNGNWVWGHSVAVVLKDGEGKPEKVLAMQQDINALKTAEQELKEKEEFLRLVTENLTEAVLVVGKDGYLKYLNETCKRFTGIESTDKPLSEWAKSFGIFSADEMTLVNLEDRPILRALAGESVLNMPLYVKQTASGEGRHIVVDAVPLKNTEGGVESALAVFRDISDKREVEARIEAGSSRIRALLESVPDMIMRLDSNGRFQYVKEDRSGRFGFVTHDVIGTYIKDQFNEEDTDLHLGYLAKAIDSKELQQYNYQLNIEGEERTFEVRMMRSAKEEVTVFIRDFTEWNLQELDRKKKEERLLALIDAWPDLLFRISREGVYLDYKAERSEELILPPEAFLGKTMKEILPDFLFEMFNPMLELAFQTKDVQTCEYQVETPAGELDYEARMVAINEEELVLFVRNITERKNQEKELKEAYMQLEEQADALVELNKELEQYAYYAAHDIKGPMNNLRSLMDMIKMEDGIKSDALPLVNKMELSLTEMNRIITALNDVLDTRKGLNMPTGQASIAKTVDQLVATLTEIIDSNGVNLTKKLNATDDIRMSPTHLHSVLQNLLLNAIKYRDPKKQSEVSIASENAENATVITVSDNGLGFDQERIGNRVFEMFKRFHDHVPGNGIGLYLVRSIVESYGGSVKVVSQLGIGTNFVLTIPS